MPRQLRRLTPCALVRRADRALNAAWVLLTARVVAVDAAAWERWDVASAELARTELERSRSA